MPEMKSPDGSETLTVSTREGVAVLAALGWTGGTMRSGSSENTDKPRRGPGRPRKSED